MLENTIYISSLYDCYGKLLTEIQREYFEDYYFQNLTCQEIGDNKGISRNAVNKQIKDAIDKLEFYEKILKLLDKRKKIEKVLENLSDDSKKEEIKRIIWE